MHPHLTIHRHPMCADLGFIPVNVIPPGRNMFPPGAEVPVLEKNNFVMGGKNHLRRIASANCLLIIEEFQKCHIDHPLGKFFGHCTDLKIKLDRCFREEKAVKRKANFEESKKMKERLRDQRKENARDER
ncbi:hypothetical protein OROMI_033514 [Orobanche minor]